MTSMSMTLEERTAMWNEMNELAARFGEGKSDLPPPSHPIVEFVPQLGIYLIARVHIRHCPWCGAALPVADVSRFPEISI
jgi:hypothetical protein